MYMFRVCVCPIILVTIVTINISLCISMNKGVTVLMFLLVTIGNIGYTNSHSSLALKLYPANT